MIREPGFYWVVWLCSSHVAEWDGEYWNFVGLTDQWKDEDLEKIHEHKLERPVF